MSETTLHIETEVLLRGQARHDMVGRFLGYPLHITEQQISAGLAKRLVRYGEHVLDDNGFLDMVQGWAVKVGTNDADKTPANRFYWVTWTNEKGGTINVTGILTSKGWPTLDHGLTIGLA